MSTTFCQEILWQKSYGGTGWDELRKIDNTPDKGFFVCGFSASVISGDKTEGSMGIHDFWVMKLDSTGSIQWQNTIGGNMDDKAMDFCLTPDGGYLVAGYSASSISGDKSEDSIGGFDYWIVKLSASGNIEWQNTIGGSGDDLLFQVIHTNDNGFLLGGISCSPISGDKTEDSLGKNDYWIVKTDSVGNVQWQNTIGGPNFDKLNCLIATKDGHYLLGGYSRSGICPDKIEANIGESDLWVMKMDSVGQIIWQNSIGGSAEDQIFGMMEIYDGFLLAATSESNQSFDKSEDAKGGSDFWLLKLDLMGNVIWDKTIGGKNDDIARDITLCTDGNFYLAGYSNSDSAAMKKEDCFGNVDYWMVKMDSLGNLLSERTLGGNERDYLYSIKLLENGNYVLGGFSKSMKSGSKTEDSPSDDYWIMEVKEPYSVLAGSVYADLNSDSIMNFSEQGWQNSVVTDQLNGRMCFTQFDGSYALKELDTTKFKIRANALNGYVVNPLTYQDTIHFYYSIQAGLDFGFFAPNSFSDIRVSLNRAGDFNPFKNSFYTISVENNGADTVAPLVKLFPSSSLQYIDAQPTPVSVNTDSIVWQMPVLLPQSATSILVLVRPDSSLIPGMEIISSVQGDDLAHTETSPFDNGDTLMISFGDTMNSFGLIVDIDTIDYNLLGNPPILEYTVYFNNDGIDTIQKITLLYNIPSKLKAETFELMATSHPLQMTYENHSRTVKFEFYSIDLTDTMTNVFNSVGYLRFRIKPKDNPIIGKFIESNMYFYADAGEPIVSNSATTFAMFFVGQAENTSAEMYLVIHPNPVHQIVNIQLPDFSLDGELTVYDITGRKYFQKMVSVENGTLLSVDVHLLPPAVYLIEWRTTTGVYRAKLLKQ